MSPPEWIPPFARERRFWEAIEAIRADIRKLKGEAEDEEKRQPWIRRRLTEWYRERRSWELNEEIRSNVLKVRAKIKARRQQQPYPTHYGIEMLLAADEALDQAEKLLYYEEHGRAPMKSHSNAAELCMNAAELLYISSFDTNPSAMDSYLASAKEIARQHLSRDDERRKKLEQLEGLKDSKDLRRLVSAVEAAYAVSLRDRLRVGNFLKIVWYATLFLAILAIAIGWLTFRSPTAVPLCVNSTTSSETPATAGESQQTPSQPQDQKHVCPTVPTASDKTENENFNQNQELPDAKLPGNVADYWVVELAGLVAASLAAAFALRKVRGTATAYNVYFALSCLKLPAGALTAVGGLILMYGFASEASGLIDTQAEIIGWALIFGYSQELFTQLVDKQGTKVLESVKGPGGRLESDSQAGET